MMRLRRRDAGISMILVVILIFITLILAVASAILYADHMDKKRTLKALEEAEQKLITEEAEILQKIVKSNDGTGFKMSEDQKSLPEAEALELQKKMRAEYWSPASLSRYPTVADKREELSKDSQDRFNRAREESTLYGTLQELAKLSLARTYHYKNRMDQLQIEVDIAKDQVRNIEALKPEVPKKKLEKKEELLKDITKVTEDIGKENAKYNERKGQLQEVKSKAEMETQAEVEKYAADEIRQTNESRELRRQLEELKVKEIIKHEISFVHGRVLRPDVPNKLAYLDIGSRERVVTGLKFLVGKKGAQGKFEFKGKIEVKKVWMTHSEVSIIELYDAQFKPIIDGDFIVNPLFSKERPVVVAFVGEPQPVRLRYSTDEASRRIKEIGSDVRKDVTLDVDYVIFTESKGSQSRESYEAFKKSVFLEIPIAEAADIFKFLGD
jgi:hypothetical protein